MGDPRKKRKTKWWHVAVIIPLAPLLLALIVVAVLLFLVRSVLLHVVIWSWWCARGRDVLFVHSNSPVWHDHIEQRILPYLGERAVVLNWSDRKRWRWSLARIAFHYFGGYRRFNPLAVVFRPFRRTRVFQFWQPFRDLKHGHPEMLQRMETEFLTLIGVQIQVPSA